MHKHESAKSRVVRGRPGNKGLTLIEVAAALALLGTMLASIVIASGRYTRQWSAAQQRIKAVELADDLLESWHHHPEGLAAVPRQSRTGQVDGFVWQVSTLEPNDRHGLEGFDARLMRLEVRQESAAVNMPALVTVDFFVPWPREEIELRWIADHEP